MTVAARAPTGNIDRRVGIDFFGLSGSSQRGQILIVASCWRNSSEQSGLEQILAGASDERF